MSVETWKIAFLPPETVPKAEAVRWAYRMWLGTRWQNLQEHGVKANHHTDTVSAGREQALLTDSMCQHYRLPSAFDSGDEGYFYQCRSCPITLKYGSTCEGYWEGYPEWIAEQASKATPGEEVTEMLPTKAPYLAWRENGNPDMTINMLLPLALEEQRIHGVHPEMEVFDDGRISCAHNGGQRRVELFATGSPPKQIPAVNHREHPDNRPLVGTPGPVLQGLDAPPEDGQAG